MHGGMRLSGERWYDGDYSGNHPRRDRAMIAQRSGQPPKKPENAKTTQTSARQQS